MPKPVLFRDLFFLQKQSALVMQMSTDGQGKFRTRMCFCKFSVKVLRI